MKKLKTFLVNRDYLNYLIPVSSMKHLYVTFYLSESTLKICFHLDLLISEKNLPHANYVFTLVHPSGTNLYILYIIPSYCENESIANVSCATKTCIVQIFITNWIILSRVMSNIFFKITIT